MMHALKLALLFLAFSACDSVNANHFHVIKRKIPAIVLPSPAFLYDTSIGNGVDANGFADLPLKAGANRYFVNSSTGSDANTCTAAKTPTTPKATAGSALTCTTDGSGDQILFAEGTAYSSSPPDMSGRVGGFSYFYPFVMQSYDPTDALNEAKYGRANGSSTHARPTFTGTLVWHGGTGQSYIALRGVDINPGNIADQFSDLEDVGSGLLFENDLFRYNGLIIKINQRPIVGQHWIVRNTAVYGEWGAGRINGLYLSGGQMMTVEDNVFYHNGWKIGGLGRDDATQGPDQFVHTFYPQHTTKVLFRRNLLTDGGADCGSHRDDTISQSSVYLYCPISIAIGGGNHADFAAPWGEALDVTYNAILNGNDLNTANARGWGIDTMRGKTTATTRYNLLAHNGGTGANSTYSVDALYTGAGSYMLFDHNISSQWSTSGGTYIARDLSADDHPTFTNNIWDDSASGSNINRASASFPNGALDAPALATGAGYASYAAMMQYAIDHPEARIQRTLLTTVMSAYGQVSPPLIDLSIDSTPWRTGNSDIGVVVGTQPESTLAFSGTWPTGFTFDPNTRFWKLDGTQSAGTATGTVTETPNGGGTPHVTNIAWTVSTAPQLTAFSVTVTGPTTATINVTTSVGDGTLYWAASGVTYLDCDNVSYCPPRLPGEVKNGRDFNDINNTTPFPKQGTKAVTATGTQSISVASLTPGSDYYAYIMQVSGAGIWSPTTNGLHALGPVHFVPN